MRFVCLVLSFVTLTSTTLCATDPPKKEPQAGSLTGQFLHDGDPPKPLEFIVPRPQVGSGTTVVDERLVVDPKTRGIRNVIVTLYGDKRPEPLYPGGKAPPLIEVPLTTSLSRFEPHVLALQTNQKINVFNPLAEPQNFKLDPSQNNALNVLVKGFGQYQFILDKHEKMPARFTDTVYPWKTGYLMVTDHPFVAVTDAQGKFKIDYLPAGEWTFRAWQEKTGYVEEVVCKALPGPWKKGLFTIKVQPGENSLGKIEVSPQEFADIQ